jgi:putative hydrolase of the HAD superfamily
LNASRIRNVVFDFGGVLVRWHPEAIITGFYADEPSRALVREAVFRHPDWIDMDRGTLNENAAIERFAARMDRPAAEMRALMQHVKDSLTPLPDSLALLDELAQRGVPLYGLSNMSVPMFALLKSRHAHWDRFRGIVISGEVGLVKPDAEIFHHLAQRGVPLYGLSNMSVPMFALLKSRHAHWDRFRGIVISGEVGLVKPDAEIFHHLAQRYHLIPAETVFIDDHLPNIESAGRLGFHPIHFANAEQCRRELATHLPDGAAI